MNYRDAIELGLTEGLDVGCPDAFGATMRRLAGWNAYQRLVERQWTLPPSRRGHIYPSDNPFTGGSDRAVGWALARSQGRDW